MQVNLLPNREKYQDIYPSSDSEEESIELNFDRETGNQEESLEAANLAQEWKDLSNELERAIEDRNSAGSQLKMLEDFAGSLKSSRPADLEAVLSAYHEQRKRAFDREVSSRKLLPTIISVEFTENDFRFPPLAFTGCADFLPKFESSKLVKEIEKKRWNWRKTNETALQKIKRKKQQVQRERAQSLQRRHEVAQDKRTAKLRRQNERAQFWPRKVYEVTVRVDTKPNLTPASSRRGSVASERTYMDSQRVSISLTYTTHSAWWTPHYDISLDTTTKSGSIVYQAESYNMTSETWRDAKIILSTSPTIFQGLGDSIPEMIPWRVHLHKSQGNDTMNGALRSSHELRYKSKFKKGSGGYARRMPNRNTLFGLDPPTPKASFPIEDDGWADEDMGFGLIDDSPEQKNIVPSLPSLFEPEASWSEAGLTASYNVPSSHTLAPSSSQHRHQIASITLLNTIFSYIITPKLRAVAFLKVDFRNTSMLTIPQGSAGLTVDGAFLGETELSRCNANESLSLNLGIDPNVLVTYEQPAVKRSSQGWPHTKDGGVYRRTCTVTNTRPDRAIEGKVFEQVPVSEDDRLKIEVLQPKGLSREGIEVSSGVPLEDGKSDGKGWGHATASLGRDGEIMWQFKIGPGRGVRFVVEYEAKFPSGETVVAAKVDGSVQEEDSDEDMGFGLFD